MKKRLIKASAFYKNDTPNGIGIVIENHSNDLEENLTEGFNAYESAWRKASNIEKHEYVDTYFKQLDHISQLRPQDRDQKINFTCIWNIWFLEKYGYLKTDNFNGLSFLYESDGKTNVADKGLTELIGPDDVSNQTIFDLLNAFNIQSEFNEKGDLSMIWPSGFHQIISVDVGGKLLKLFSIFRLKTDTERKEKIEFVNKLNNGVIFSRFSMPNDHILLADYYQTFEDGIMPAQILRSMQLFEKVTMAAIDALDDSNLVE